MRRSLLFLLLGSVLLLGGPRAAQAGGPTNQDRTLRPEDEDFSESPFTEYGSFNEEEDEEADTKFFQFGRFFGVSIGLGFETVDGGRGLLWSGGLPMFDFKLHYWFDFNFALALGIFTAPHFYVTSVNNIGHMDVNMMHLGVDLKYYFDTKNLAAPISFANPFLLVGAGSYSKTETSATQGTTDSDSSVGINLGGGLEFALKPRKSYFQLEGKIHVVKFKDTSTNLFQSQGIPDLSGNFYTLTGNMLFTW